MSQMLDINKVLVLGSGPDLVGNVTDLDRFTLRAIDAYLDQGLQVVLLNPNPASVSTDKRAGLTVYLEPMTLDFLKRILRMEEPDAIATAFGSATALQILRDLQADGILESMHIDLLTINEATLVNTQVGNLNRYLELNNIPRAEKKPLTEVEADELTKLTYPVWLTKENPYVQNSHFKFANAADLADFFAKQRQLANFNLKNFNLYEDLSEWEEVIINVIRDKNGNVVFLNYSSAIEPVSLIIEDSVVVTPALTLNNDQVDQLRHLTKRALNGLNLVGFASLRFAVQHSGTELEAKCLAISPYLNNSALVAVSTGMYDVAYVTATVSLGIGLQNIINPLTGIVAAMEPVYDTINIKFPYWSFTKSGENHYQLGSHVLASGSVLGVGRNFETAFLKGLHSTTSLKTLVDIFKRDCQLSEDDLLTLLSKPDESHMLHLLAAIYVGISYPQIHAAIRLHPLYYQKLSNLVDLIKRLQSEQVNYQLLASAKIAGFSTEMLALITHQAAGALAEVLSKHNFTASYLSLDGTAGLQRAKQEVFYKAYNVKNELQPLASKQKVLLIGMHPFEVSLTSEFDYLIAHAIKALKEQGIATVVISNNDQAVSSSYQLADRVFVEPINLENILEICKQEQISKVVTQFSGKEINSLRQALIKHGLQILGQEADTFQSPILAQQTNVQQVEHLTSNQVEEIFDFTKHYGFPVLIGAKNGISKQKSAVVYDTPALKQYVEENTSATFTVSRFISGQKYEAIAVSDGKDVKVPGIIEHLEQTGSHASDSIAVFPTESLSLKQKQALVKLSKQLIKPLKIKGLMTLHFLLAGDSIYLLQIKTYAGHNIAFLSKALDQDLAEATTNILIGQSLAEQGLIDDNRNDHELMHVKMPVFSYLKYTSNNTFDSKMKSSGSVMGRDKELAKALYKGYEGSSLQIPSYGTVFISARKDEIQATINLAKRLHRLGFKILATEGTANALAEAGITTGIVPKVRTEQTLLTKINQHNIGMVINVTNLKDKDSKDAVMIRDTALATKIPVFSSIKTAELVVDVLESLALTTQPI